MTEAAHINVDTEVTGEQALVRLSGELDLDGAGPVAEQIVALADGNIRTVVIDASDVSFLDSSGLRALLTAREQLEKLDVVLRVDSPSAVVERVLDMTGTRQLLGG